MSFVFNDTHDDMPIKEFQNMLLDRGFQIGGCVEYLDDNGYGQKKDWYRETFFYKGSALIKTSEYLIEDHKYNTRNKLGFGEEHLTFKTQNLPNSLYFNVHENTGSFYDKKMEKFRWHGVSVREALFSKVDDVISSEYLCPKLILEKDSLSPFEINNLITNRQYRYSGIMQELLGGLNRDYFDTSKIGLRCSSCDTLGQLMGLRENLKHFTPEFKDVLKELTTILDKEIAKERKNIGYNWWFKKKGLPTLKWLIEDDVRTMQWRNVGEIEKEIRDYSLAKNESEKVSNIDALISRATAISEQSRGLADDLSKFKDGFEKD